MAEKKHVETTRLYEIVAQISGYDDPLVLHINQDECDRLVRVLENDERSPDGFYGFDMVDGLECYINLSSILKINVLDYIGGVLFEKPSKRTDEECSKWLEERELSDAPVILRIWSAGKTELYPEVEYGEWTGIRFTLEEHDQRFFGFADEDGERVILQTNSVDAVELFDPHYLSEEDLQRLLNGSTAEGDNPVD